MREFAKAGWTYEAGLVGHSVGPWWHQQEPIFCRGARQVLEPGMVVALEPYVTHWHCQDLFLITQPSRICCLATSIPVKCWSSTAGVTYLRQSPATVDIVPGDARLSLERETGQPSGRHQYHLFVIDAFSSGSIPMHLLTRESVMLYRQALAPDGVIAFHISNHHLDLRPVIRGHARESGMASLEFIRAAEARTAYSAWAVISNDQSFIARGRPLAQPVTTDARSLLWTDGFSSLTSVLR